MDGANAHDGPPSRRAARRWFASGKVPMACLRHRWDRKRLDTFLFATAARWEINSRANRRVDVYTRATRLLV
jgi:hypothetical protein